LGKGLFLIQSNPTFMRKHYLLFTVAAISLSVSTFLAQNDPWTSIVNNGFGSTNNSTVFAMDGFNSKLYAGTQLKAPTGSPAQVWKSSTGTSGSFTQIPTTAFTPQLFGSDMTIIGMSHTNLAPGYIYMGTLNKAKGAAVYRSSDGVSWIKISKRGMGNAHNTEVTPNYVVFNGGTANNYLYVGARDTSHPSGVASIWRTLYNDADSTHWTKVLDFNVVSPIVQQTTFLYVWNNTIYACVSDTIAHLYQSTDGVNWIKNAGVGNGFGVIGNHHIASMADYKGFLYASTFNTKTGGQVWRTSNGTTWTKVTGNAFGQGTSITEMRRTISANGWLWIAGQYFAGGAPVGDYIWRTSDGATWTQSNQPGFGVSGNNSGFPTMTSLNGFVYHSPENLTTGGQIWRTNVGIPVAGFTDNLPSPCVKDTVRFTDTSQTAVSYKWFVNGVKFDTTANPYYVFSPAGSYTVMQVVTNNGLTDTARHTIVVNSCATGISGEADNALLNIYPNPGNGLFTIRWEGMGEEKITLNVFNLVGQNLFSEDVECNHGKINVPIDLQHLSAGTYFAVLNGRIGSWEKKIIISK
jgi:hypothetical protein